MKSEVFADTALVIFFQCLWMPTIDSSGLRSIKEDRDHSGLVAKELWVMSKILIFKYVFPQLVKVMFVH